MKTLFSLLFALLLISCNSQTQVLGILKNGAAAPLNLNNARIVADGNSYMQGNGYTSSATYLVQSTPFSTNGTTMVNYAVGGQNTTQMLSDQSSQVFPAFQTGKVNILLVQEGGNDLAVSASVSTAVANMKTYCNNARAYCQSAGITLRIIIYTLIPRNQTGNFATIADFNNAMVAYNSAVLADNSFYDGVVRMDLEPIYATYTSGGYDADKVHPNTLGQQTNAQRAKEIILNFTQ